jgi:hypothetical protein
MIKDPEKYRQKAAEARERADKSADEKEKSYWLAIATEWQRAADAAEALKRT